MGVQRSRPQVSSSALPREVGPTEVAARLERLADVRSTVVARGKALIADPNYPNKKTTRAIAQLLATKWAAR